MLLTNGDSEFSIAIASFWLIEFIFELVLVVEQTSSNSITSSTCKGERSAKEGSVLSQFIMTCKISFIGTLVNRLTTSKLTRQNLPHNNLSK
jgi:hypothetical protein